MSDALLWLRRDLRVRDHPALCAAAASADRVVPVFCFDDGLLKGRHASGPRTQFLIECLEDLDASLRERGSRLFVRHGTPQRELLALARECGASEIHFSADVGPFARRRQAEVKRALHSAGVEVIAHPGLFAVDDLEPICTTTGDPYTVFTPFYRTWLRQPRREVLGAPRALAGPSRRIAAGKLPRLSALGLTQEVSDPALGGEVAARAAVSRFLRHRVDRYGEGRDELATDAVSRLSAYLHFGCVTPREVEHRLSTGEGAAPRSSREI